MIRMMLIALTVMSLFCVGLSEATTDRVDPATPVVEDGSSLEELVSNTAQSTSPANVVFPVALKLPLYPTDCSPGISCTVREECGVIYSHGGVCHQGECVGGSCYCY